MKKILLLLLIPIIVFSSEPVDNLDEIDIDEHLENIDRFFPDDTYKGLYCDDRKWKKDHNLLTVSIETNNVYHFLNYRFIQNLNLNLMDEEYGTDYTYAHWIDIDNNKIDYCEKRVYEDRIDACKFYGDQYAPIIYRNELYWKYSGEIQKYYNICVILSKEEMQQKASELASLIKENQKEIDYWRKRELDERKL